MRIPEAVELYKDALPLIFPGLTISNDLSNRSADHTVSASTSWTIWYDPVTNQTLRSSAADGLLWASNQQRDSLTVLANHKVDKVIFQTNNTATGVMFGIKPDSNIPGSLPGMHTVHAAKEVILAAGSLASASVLERSGVGKASVLQGAGVEKIVDLPGVGCNLVDQPGTGAAALVAMAYQNDLSIIDDVTIFAPDISLVNIDQIFGPNHSSIYTQLTSLGNLESRAQALVTAGAAANQEGATRILNVTIDLIVNYQFPVAEFIGESYPTILEAIFWPLMPLSRGHIHINSSDPFQDPIIVPRFLTDSFDQQVVIAVSRRSQSLFASALFAEVIADPYYVPGISLNASDAEWLAWYKNTSYGASHWVGSTAMLPRELGGVVDFQLRVYGTSGLRVVDAGILPFEITSHPMSLLYATAQKAATLILSDAGYIL
ncbi:Glucose oxidase [Cytospora mali]|uniref:Glucose oxidase n=1 Tax=Cytospora mali TaxID=578113 RepID=A0A194VPW8_CYTMA|nr:Glucose oxidase [Valsa mali]